jgi:predicted short-subunit dehydrogenase-like oxidoreductase (DUF2520 family)
MKVVIIGSGNVASVLGKKIAMAGHIIVQILSKNINHAQKLAIILNANATDEFKAISNDAEIYIIAVNDDSVKEIAVQLNQVPGIVVHTAGGIGKQVLEVAGTSFGVIYPLQSLRKEMDDIPLVPVLVDGSNDIVTHQLKKFAETWSSQVTVANDEQRMKLHVAAVITSNFTNHLYVLAENYCNKENVDFELLLPLIEETANRLKNFSPSEVQTGPAVRNDLATINKHLLLLQNYPELRLLYLSLTESIINDQKLKRV